MLTVNYKIVMTPETARTLAPSYSKDGLRYPLDKSLSSGYAIGFHITFPLSSTIQLLNKAVTWK